MYDVIGIAGRAGAGKDTVADILSRELKGRPWYRYSFADPIKRATEFMFGWRRDQLEDRDFKEAICPKWGFSPRRAMQLLGTEFGRACREDLWLHMASMELDEVKRGTGGGLIISDVRFPNEADWVRDNGLLIHVDRAAGNETSETSHASEIPLERNPNDWIIHNQSDLNGLTESVQFMARRISDLENWSK